MKWNKFLALLLSLMMILSMTAFASETELPSDPKDNQRVEDSEGGDEDIPDVPLDVSDQDEETEEPDQPDQPEAPVTPEEPEQPEVPETPEMPEEPEQPEDPEVPETPETPDQPAEDGIAALFDNRPSGGNQSSVDHIDIACNNLRAKVYVDGEWKTEFFNFTEKEVQNGTVKVEISSSGASFTLGSVGTSTGQTTGSQVRFNGTFPVGTIDSPVYYTVKLTKSISVDGVMVPVTLTATYSYWSSENDCPGLSGNKTSWRNGAVISGSGIDLVLSEGTATSGSITIAKQVEGLDLTEDKVYTFEIYNEGGARVQTVNVTVSKESKAGNAIVSLLPFGSYTIKEVGAEVGGYNLVTNISGGATLSSSNPGAAIAVTNTYTYVPTTTSISVTKEWDDGDDQDGKRPETVTVNLLANGQPTGKTLTLSADGNWTGAFRDLPLKADGQDIVYTVSEDAVAGYESKITGDAATGYTVTNAHTSETTFVSGSKTWNDADDQDGLRPTSITVNLLANGVKVDSKVVSADANGAWSWKFDNLPKYAGGKAIAYTVSEEPVYGYTAQANGGSLINTHIPETTTVSGSKTWNDADDQDGKRPGSITIRLLADGKEIASKTVTADDGWKWSFNNLPVYEAGKRIAYIIAEDAVEGYSAEVQGYDVTNSYTPGKTSVNVTKIWDDGDNQDGKRPETVTVNLLANGQATGKKLTLSADGGWQGSFTDLDEYQGGKKIVYTIAEDEVALYTGNVDGFVITNSYTPSVRDVSGRKVWDDDGDRDGIRPDSIVVYLWANGVKAAQTTATAEADWTFCFEGMPVYEQGKEILYTVTEEPVPGYTAAVEGLVITNTHEISVIDVCGKKTWDDENDADGKRPDSITIRLLADGVEIDARVVTSKEGWSWSFNGLPQYAAGKEIVYTLSEDKIDGYTAVVKGYNVTNVHEVEDDEVPKTGDARSDLQGILLMAGLALLMTGAALGVTARKRGKN